MLRARIDGCMGGGAVPLNVSMSKVPSILNSRGFSFRATDVSLAVPRWDIRGVTGVADDFSRRASELSLARGDSVFVVGGLSQIDSTMSGEHALWAGRKGRRRTDGNRSERRAPRRPTWRDYAAHIAGRLKFPNQGRHYFDALSRLHGMVRSTWQSHKFSPTSGDAWLETPLHLRSVRAPLARPLDAVVQALDDPYVKKPLKRIIRSALWAAHSYGQHLRSLLGLFQDVVTDRLQWEQAVDVMRQASEAYRAGGQCLAPADLFSPMRNILTSAAIAARGYHAEVAVGQLLAQHGHCVRSIPSLHPRTRGCVDYELDGRMLAELKFTAMHTTPQWERTIARAVGQLEHSRTVFKSLGGRRRPSMLLWAYDVPDRMAASMHQYLYDRVVIPRTFDAVVTLALPRDASAPVVHDGLQYLHGADGKVTLSPYERRR